MWLRLFGLLRYAVPKLERVGKANQFEIGQPSRVVRFKVKPFPLVEWFFYFYSPVQFGAQRRLYGNRHTGTSR
jgi:hypothetical protein